MEKLKKSGGYRLNSGRPKGSGKFKENTHPIRVPKSLIPQIHDMLDYYVTNLSQIRASSDHSIYEPALGVPVALPLYSSRVAAGFPSPADDHMESSLDLNQYLIKHPAA